MTEPKKKCRTGQMAMRAGAALILSGVAHQCHSHWHTKRVGEGFAWLSDKVLGPTLEVMVGRRPTKEEIDAMAAAFSDMKDAGFLLDGDTDIGLGI